MGVCANKARAQRWQRRGPSIETEIRWCPSHKGSPETRSRTDGPRRPPASRTTTGVKWLAYANGVRRPMPPTSLAHLKRRASEKWPEARSWCEQKANPNPTPDRAEKRTASRFYQLSPGMPSTACTRKARRTGRTTTAGCATRKVLDFLRSHPCRKDSSTGRGELGQRGRSGGGGDGRRGGASVVVTRGLLVSGSLLCVFFLSFQNVYFPLCGLFLFLPFYLVGALTALNCCRPSGRAGRQELIK